MSSARIAFARYGAVLACVMLPLTVFACLSNMSVWGAHAGEELDYLALLAFSLGWVRPTAMAAIAVGMLLTELTGTPVAAAAQGLWRFLDLNLGVTDMSRDSYALFRLMPRHHSLRHTDVFPENLGTLAANRLLYAGLAGLPAVVY